MAGPIDLVVRGSTDTIHHHVVVLVLSVSFLYLAHPISTTVCLQVRFSSATTQAHSMSQGQRCDQCGSRSLSVLDGRLVCDSCHTQSQDFHQSVADVDDMASSFMSTMSAKRARSLQELSNAIQPKTPMARSQSSFQSASYATPLHGGGGSQPLLTTPKYLLHHHDESDAVDASPSSYAYSASYGDTAFSRTPLDTLNFGSANDDGETTALLSALPRTDFDGSLIRNDEAASADDQGDGNDDRQQESYLEAMQRVLQMQAEALIEFCGISKLITRAIRSVWFAYLHRLHSRWRQVLNTDGRLAIPKTKYRHNLPSKVPRRAGDADDEVLSLQEQFEHFRMIVREFRQRYSAASAAQYESFGMPLFCITLSICHIACTILREPVTLHDITRLVSLAHELMQSNKQATQLTACSLVVLCLLVGCIDGPVLEYCHTLRFNTPSHSVLKIRSRISFRYLSIYQSIRQEQRDIDSSSVSIGVDHTENRHATPQDRCSGYGIDIALSVVWSSASGARSAQDPTS
jgi:hypothetical protein